MKVEKKDLEKSQIELIVELSQEEFKPYIDKGVEVVSKEAKIEGFRPGKVPFEILKQKIGEMTILEEAARIAINKTIDKAIKDNVEKQVVGQPKVDITKVAPDNPLEYKVTLAILPETKLGEYKDFKIKQKKTEILEKEVEKMINDLQEMRAKEVASNDPIGETDKAIVNIQMFLDKVPVEGGQSQETAVLIDKDYVVPGFGKKLIGAKKDEEKSFQLPYPKDHHMKNLAGKMVDFRVKVKDIFKRELPELNDEFALGFGVKKIDELKTNIRKSLEDQKGKENIQSTEKEMLEKIVAKARFGDIPQVLIEQESNTMMAELAQGIEGQGGKFEDYLTSIEKTREQMILDMLPEAIKRVKTSLIIKEIADQEKIKVDEKDLEKHMEDMKKYYASLPEEQAGQKDEIVKQIDTPQYRSYVYNVLSSRKVIDKLREWNIETK